MTIKKKQVIHQVVQWWIAKELTPYAMILNYIGKDETLTLGLRSGSPDIVDVSKLSFTGNVIKTFEFTKEDNIVTMIKCFMDYLEV